MYLKALFHFGLFITAIRVIWKWISKLPMCHPGLHSLARRAKLRRAWVWEQAKCDMIDCMTFACSTRTNRQTKQTFNITNSVNHSLVNLETTVKPTCQPVWLMAWMQNALCTLHSGLDISWLSRKSYQKCQFHYCLLFGDFGSKK